MGAGSGDGWFGVEALRDPGDVAAALAGLSDAVADEVCSFMTVQPDASAAARGRLLDEDLLMRGVTLRMVCLEAFHRDAAVARHLVESVERGVHIRTTPVLPTRMLIFDRQVAILPLDLMDASAGVIRIATPTIVHLLHGLFEVHWSAATPVRGMTVERPPAGPQPMELAVLNLMALGHKDDAIARSTGQSSRTVRRVVAGLAESLGARSRFDLALRAAARDWVSSPFDD